MPGPDIIYVIMLSISKGKKQGIVTALGLVSGIIIHTTLIAFGIAAIINGSEGLFWIIKILGALYLFYLAYKTYKSSTSLNLTTSNISDKSYLELFKQGFIMNVLNPKVVIFFLAFFPGFIIESRGNITQQIYLLGFLFMLQAFLVFSLVSVTADKLTRYLRDNKKFEKQMHWFQILVFIAIGIFILFSDK
ncbi:MAG: LysE family translocator [Flavobacteriaceae bacterium]|nr:LysE family translocator [Flavobacteriaceae bacterium]